MRPVRGAWAQLRAGMNDAVAHFRLHGRRLRAEFEAEQIFEMSPALLAVAGFDGYLRRFNPAFEVFGYSREELLSRPWVEFAHPDDRERMRQAAASLEEVGSLLLALSAKARMCILHRSVHMRTNIVIDDKLMRDTLRATGLKTKREAVELGLRTLLTLRKQGAIRQLRGKLDWQGDLNAMRTDR